MQSFYRLIFALYIISLFFGLTFIASKIYSSHQNILIANLNAEKVEYGIFQWRKDKYYGAKIDHDFTVGAITTAFQQVFYDFCFNGTLKIDWIFSNIEYLLRISESLISESIIFINSGMYRFLIGKQREEFEKLVKKLAQQFDTNFGIGQVRFTSSSMLFETIMTYIGFNSILEYVPEDKVYFNCLADFSRQSFSMIYYVKPAEINKGLSTDPRLIQYDLNNKQLNLFTITNKCFGQMELFLRMSLKNSSGNVISSCLPQNTVVNRIDTEYVQVDTTCRFTETSKNFTITGTGSQEGCLKDIKKKLTEFKCKDNYSGDSGSCFDQPVVLPKNMRLFVANHPTYMLRDLERWHNVTPGMQNFSNEYHKMMKNLCGYNINNFEYDANFYGLNMKKLKLYCWQMVYYEHILNYFGYDLKDWGRIKFIVLNDGFTRGLAAAEANAQKPRILISIFADLELYYVLALLGLIPLYFLGIAKLYYDMSQRYKTRQVFVSFFAYLLEFRKVSGTIMLTKKKRLKKRKKSKNRIEIYL